MSVLWICVYATACHAPSTETDTQPHVEALAPIHNPPPPTHTTTQTGAGPESRWPYSVRSKVLAAEVIEVVSLYPAPLSFAALESTALATQIAKQQPIDGYGVLGVAVLSDDDQIEAMAEMITAALASQDVEPTSETQSAKITPSSCFWPRHALRFYRGADRVDVLLCFVCRRAEVIEHTVGNAQLGSSLTRWTLALNGHPQTAESLNELLRSEGVMLPDLLP